MAGFSKDRVRKMILHLMYATISLEKELGIELGVKIVIDEPVLKFFTFEHLPQHLQDVSKPFSDLAATIVAECEAGPERTVALRKLLEAKDAAVRSKVNPGG